MKFWNAKEREIKQEFREAKELEQAMRNGILNSNNDRTRTEWERERKSTGEEDNKKQNKNGNQNDKMNGNMGQKMRRNVKKELKRNVMKENIRRSKRIKQKVIDISTRTKQTQQRKMLVRSKKTQLKQTK